MKFFHGVLLVSAFLVITLNTSFAQSSYTADSASSVTGMGGPLISLGSVHGNFAFYMGGAGGLVIRDVTIGAFGMGQTTQITDWTAPEKYISIACGGVWLGYAFIADKTVHPVVDVLAGIGTLNTFVKNSYYSNNADKAGLYVVVPRVGAEFNAGDYVRISIGAEYRYFGFMKRNDTFSSSDISSPGGYITVKLGGF